MGQERAGVPLVLQRVPDARRAPVPLLQPAFLPYVALMLGAAVAAVLALYNSVALRRVKPAMTAVAVGALGWAAGGILFVALRAGGLGNVLLALLPVRLLNIGLGALLAWSQWSHVRGHTFLEGRTVVLLHAVLAALAIFLLMPVRPLLVLQGLWVLLGR